nr:MAG TPA: hypothetical protein [Caudoviricetes sp.]
MAKEIRCHNCKKEIPEKYVMWTMSQGKLVPVHRDCSRRVYRADPLWDYSKKRKKNK